MRDSLQRLYETKLAFLATVFTFAGIALLLAAHLEPRLPALRWLANLPVADLGAALFTTGLVVIAFEYLDGRDSEERATIRLRRVLDEQAPAMRDAVIRGFAFDAEDLKRVSSPEVLDQVTRNSLVIQLGDADFAAEVYDDLKAQVIRAGERWHDLRVTVDLSHWERGNRGTITPLYVATIRWEYSGVPTTNLRRFASVSSAQEYRDLLQEPASSSVWRFTPVNGLTADSPEAFELVQFSVDDVERPIRRTARDGSQVYSVGAGKAIVEAGEPVKIAYTYKTLIRRDGHLLYLTLAQPTKGVRIELRYGDTDISAVKVLDFIGGAGRTKIIESPSRIPESSLAASLDSWVFPGTGTAFVWENDDKLENPTSQKKRLRNEA